MPTPPPIVQLSPIEVLPAIPVHAAIAVLLPIVTLCAIWTKLSILQLFFKIVLSIQEYL